MYFVAISSAVPGTPITPHRQQENKVTGRCKPSKYPNRLTVTSVPIPVKTLKKTPEIRHLCLINWYKKAIPTAIIIEYII
jgi:hypothetical protein